MQRFGRFFVVLFAFFASAMIANAATLYVSGNAGDDTNPGTLADPYATIAKALTVASGGDTIMVDGYTAGGPDVYNETVLINSGLNDLVLEGWDSNGGTTYPVLEYAAGVSRRIGIDVRADNVTIKNFTIQNYTASANPNPPFGNDGGAALVVFNQTSGHIIDNVTIDNCTWGIYVDKASNIQILNTDITGIAKFGAVATGAGGIGINVWAITDTDMDNIFIGVDKNGTAAPVTISNVDGDAIRFGRDGATVNTDGSEIKNVTVTGHGQLNNGTDDGYGLAFYNLTGTVDVEANTINSSRYGMYLDADAIASNADVYVHDNTFYSNITDDIIVRAGANYNGELLYQLWVNNDNFFMDAAKVAQSAAALDQTNDEIIDSDVDTDKFIRVNVQTAINDAAANTRVRVAEGTYNENLEITDNGLELFSSDDSQPALHKLVSNVDIADAVDNFTSTRAGFEIAADDVKVHGFEFSSTNADADAVVQLAVMSADGEIYNNAFSINGKAGAQSYGIVNDQLTTTDGNDGLTINNNTFTSANSNDVTAIRLYGSDDPPIIPPAPELDVPAGTVVITSNTFSGNLEFGIYNERSKVNITSNTFSTTGTPQDGILIENNSDVDLQDVLIQCNTFSAFNSAIHVAPAATDDYSNINIYSNTISDANFYGILVTDGADNVTVMYHNFTGTFGTAAVSNKTNGETLDVTENWWNNANGPTHADNTFMVGSQGQVLETTGTAAVTFAPWWGVAGTDACPSVMTSTNFIGPVYVYDATETTLRGMYPSITSALAAATTVDTDHIIVVNGQYKETVTVNKEVYIRGKKTIGGATGLPVGTQDSWVTGTAGATGTVGTDMPTIILPTAGTELMIISDENVTVRGVAFKNTGATNAVEFSGTRTNTTFEYCSFELDGGYGVEVAGAAAVTNLDMNYNVFAMTNPANLMTIASDAGNVATVDLTYNTFNAGNIYMDVTASAISAFNINNNMFTDGGVQILGNGAGSLTGLDVQYNTFAGTAAALYVASTVDDGAEVSDWATDVTFAYNKVTTTADPAFGFENSALSVTGNNLNAVSNWWNHANGPMVKNDGNYTTADYEYNQFNYPTQGVIVTPGVDFVRWFDSDALTNLYGPIWNNDTPVEYYANLETAIANTDAAGTVTVDEGTFQIGTDVDVTAGDITVTGHGANTILDGQYSGTVAVDVNMIYINADNVTIDNMTIDLGDEATDFNHGIHIEDAGTSNTIYITNNTMRYAAASGSEELVHLGMTGGFYVQGNTFETATGNRAISSTSTVLVDQVEISGNTFDMDANSLNTNGGHGIYLYRLDNATITNNTFANSDYAVQLGDLVDDQNNVDITCNTFTNIISKAVYVTNRAPGGPINVNVDQNFFTGTTPVAVEFEDDNNIPTGRYINCTVNENVFDLATTAYAIVLAPGTVTSPNTIDATNNYYGEAYGPKTTENTYGAAYADRTASMISSTPGEVIFTPFWTDVTGSACSYAGTSFAPIVRADQEATIGATIDSYHASIEAALAETNVPGTNNYIWVKGGSYYEASPNVLDNDLIIVGKLVDGQTPSFTTGTPGVLAGAPEIINTTGSQILNINANNVTVKGLKFNTTDSQISTIWGISIQGVTNLDITNNDFDFSEATTERAIYATAAALDQLSLTYNTFAGNDGYALEKVGNIDFTNSAITNNQLSNATLYIEALAGNVNTVNIANNDFTNGNAVVFAGTGQLDMVTVLNNNFNLEAGDKALDIASGLTVGTDWTTDMVFRYNNVNVPTGTNAVDFQVAAPANPILATCNWWGTVDGPTASTSTKVSSTGAQISDNVTYLPWLSDGSDDFPTTVGFQTSAACNGANVMVATSATYGNSIVSYHAGIQDAIDAAADGQFIHVSAGDYDEDLSITYNLGFVNNGTVNVVDNTNFSGHLTNNVDKTMTLYNSFAFDGNITLGQTAKIVLQDNDLSFGGVMNKDASVNTWVVTNGMGNLRKTGANHTDLHTFYVGTSANSTRYDIQVKNTDFTGGTLTVSVNDTNAATYKSKGEAAYALNHTYFLHAYDNTDTEVTSGLNADLYFYTDLADQGASFIPLLAYGAIWNDTNSDWDSYRVGAVHANDHVQIPNVDKLDNTWGIFSGASNFALSNLPTPARLIMFRSAPEPDSEVKLRWTNGSGNGVAIVVKETDNLTIAATDEPVDGTQYTDVAGTSEVPYADADGLLLGGAYVVFNQGSGTLTREIIVDNLQPGTDYRFAAYSYNDSASYTNYNTYIEDAPDPAIYNPRVRTTYPRGTMWVEGGEHCDATAPVDTCNIICEGSSANLVFNLEGGTVGNLVQIKYSIGSTTQQLPSNPGSFPRYEAITPTETTTYKLISMRDNDGVLCVIKPSKDQAQVVVHTVPSIAIADAAPGAKCEGSSVTINSTATANPALTSPTWWYNSGAGWTVITDGVDILAPGFNTPTLTNGNETLTINNLDAATADNLQIKVVYGTTSICVAPLTEAESNIITLDVDATPVPGTFASTAPEFCETETISITVDNSAAVQTAYEWEYWNGAAWTNVMPADASVTGTTLTIASNQLTYNGAQFRVSYVNGSCTTPEYSDVVTLTVYENPVVTPIAQSPATPVCDGDNKDLSITTTVGTIKWFKNGTEIVGETATTLSVASLDGDEYYAVVTNGTCEVTTATVTLVGAPAATITESFSATEITCEDGDLTFTTSVTNLGAGTLQWEYTDGSGWTSLVDGSTNPTVAGATTNELTLTNIPASWNTYKVRLVADNTICETISAESLIEVVVSPTPVNAGMVNQTVCHGGFVIFSATAPATQNCAAPAQTWEVMLPSGSWTDITGLTTYAGASLYFSGSNIQLADVPNAWNGAQIRAAFECSPCAPVYTTEATISVDTIPLAPATVTATLPATAPFNSEVDVTWAAVSNANVYNVVFWNTATNAEDFRQNNVFGTSLHVMGCNQLIPNTNYEVRVYAVNNCGTSEYATTSYLTPNPTIAVGPWNATPSFTAILENTVSTETFTFDVTYSNLDGDVKVEVLPSAPGAQAHFEFTIDGTNWYTNNTFTQAALPSGTTVTARFAPQDPGIDITSQIQVSEVNTCYTVPVANTTDMVGTGLTTPPAYQAKHIQFTANTDNTFTFDFDWNVTGDTPQGAIIVLTEGSTLVPFGWTPTPNTDYTATGTPQVDGATNASWSTTGATYQVVGDLEYSTGLNTVTVEGLAANTNYVVHIFLYNGTTTLKNYNTSDETRNAWMLQELYFVTNPGSVEVTGQVFSPFQVGRKDRAGTDITTPLTTVTLKPVDATTKSDIIATEGGTLTDNTIDIHNTLATATHSTFVWSCADSTQGRAFNQLAVSATGYMTGYSTTTYDGNNGFVLRAAAPGYTDIFFRYNGEICDPNSGYAGLTYRWRTRTVGSTHLVVMKQGSEPSVPEDGTWYDYATPVSGRINFNNCDTVVNSATKAIYRTSNLTMGTDYIYNLNQATTYYAAVHPFYYNQTATGAARNATVNYNSDRNQQTQQSRTTPQCRVVAGGVYVELDNMSAESFDSKAFVKFTTAFEQGIAGFDVYRMSVEEAMADLNRDAYVKVSSFMNNEDLVANGGSNNTYSIVDEDVTLTVGKEYFYKVVAIGVDGNEYELGIRELVINNNTLVNGNVEVSEIAPNPAVNRANFNITLQAATTVNIEVLDITGRSVAIVRSNAQMTAGTTPVEINLNNVTSGTYILSIHAGDHYIIKKFVVNK